MLKINSYNSTNISYYGKTRDLLMARKYASTRLITNISTKEPPPKPVRKKHKIKSYVSYFKRQLLSNKKISGE